MPVVDEDPARTARPGPGPARGVDQALLHRRHPEEAFLTGAVPTGPAVFRAEARLPAEHPHYRGHTGPSRDRDPMLLLECARQAETYAAHALYGVGADARFVLRAWSATFPGDVPVAGAAEVRLVGSTRDPRTVGGRLRGLGYDLDLWAGDRPLGSVRMDVDYPSDAAYRVLRRRKHPDGLPNSDDVAPAGGRPVDPARVGRLRHTDTVLQDVGIARGVVTAGLRVPLENRSMFDHAQDHIPAMVLMEAARQIAALATAAWGGPGPDRTTMTALTATFADYAELTTPVVLSAEPAPGEAGWVKVVFEQAGAVAARVDVTMTGAPGRGPSCPAPRS